MQLQRHMLFGVTHTLDAQPKLRAQVVGKVAIGLKGGQGSRDIEVVSGTRQPDGSVPFRVSIAGVHKHLATRKEAEDYYWDAIDSGNVPERRAPKRLHYFTFLRPGPGGWHYDFDRLEQAGKFPRQIQVVFADLEPLEMGMRLFQKGRLRCQGDGLNALRHVEFVTSRDWELDAKEAIARGDEWYPMPGMCREKGCPLAKAPEKGKASCAAWARLLFQFANEEGLTERWKLETHGGTSINFLAAGLESIRRIAAVDGEERGRIDGIPILLTAHQQRIMQPDGNVGTHTVVSASVHGRNQQEIESHIRKYAVMRRGVIMPLVELPEEDEAEEEFAGAALERPEQYAETVGVVEAERVPAETEAQAEEQGEFTGSHNPDRTADPYGLEANANDLKPEPDAGVVVPSAEKAAGLGLLSPSLLRNYMDPSDAPTAAQRRMTRKQGR